MVQLSKQDVYAALAAQGVTGDLARIMAAGSYAESGWISDRCGDNGDSWGLFQLNTNGLGAGMSVEARCDPAQAIARMLPEYVRELARWAAVVSPGAELCSIVCGFAEKPYEYQLVNSTARRAYAAAWAMAAPDEAPPAPHPYDPDAPAERQVQAWTCSVRTATWLANSLGYGWDAGDVQDRMVAAGLVSEADGLEDGTGESLERWLHFQTGLDTLGRQAITWAQLQALAGHFPIGMGSGTLYHWLAVRRALADGTLQLMNPAPGYRNVGDGMDRATFDQWAPWHAIWLVAPDAPEEDELSAAERAELEQYRTDQPYYDTLLGSKGAPGGLIGGALDTLEAAAGTSKTPLAHVVREQVTAVRKAAGL